MKNLYRGRVRRSTFMSDFGKLLVLVVLAAVWSAISVTMHTRSYAEPAKTAAQTAVLSAMTTVSGAHTEPITNLADTSTTSSSATCTVNRTYVSPAALDLSSLNDGLTVARDPLTSYSVTGDSIAQLRTNVTNCAAREKVAGTYHAITARNISWSYGAVQEGAVCRTTDVKVGLHIAQFIPNLVASSTTPPDVINTWNTYQTSLTAHEEGHVNNAKQYAAQIDADIAGATASDCDSLRKQVAITIDADLTQLSNTDILYDAQTNHGATQGAVL